ncbi:MAG: chorismate-binding protein [Mangrovibacterium sp.]
MTTELINTLLLKGKAFAAWAMPGAEVELMVAKPDQVNIINDESELDDLHGFIFAPFQKNDSCPLVLLQGTHLKTAQEMKDFQITGELSSASERSGRHRPFIISQSEYLTDINQTVEHLHKSELSKVVISRINEMERGEKSIGEVMELLREQNPRAFVYVVSIPKVGTWIGATPESLLQMNAGHYETMSLAGTQSQQQDADYRWRTKEIEEQAFVSRYILEAFHDLGIHPYTTIGPNTLESGGLAHLHTSFQFAPELVEGKLSAFVKRLHPTPAVCGLPKAEALTFIGKMEKHKRRYYSGYLGTWQMEGGTNLFVNLRCMELMGNQCLIYVGGGITTSSNAAEEWEETEKKAEVMMRVMPPPTPRGGE